MPSDTNRRSGGTSTLDPLQPSQRVLLALFAVLTLAALVPLFVVDVVPLANMPNHMARMRILAEIGQDPALAQNYRLNWGLQPNLGMDLVLSPLAGIVAPLELGRWFTALCMVMLAGGTVAIYRALNGRLDIWPAALFLFMFNHVLIWGFLNFLSGLGLALLGFAAWIRSADRPGWRRTALFSLLAITLFFAHLMALGIYGLLVGAWEVGRMRDRWPDWKGLVRDWALGAAQFLPAFALFILALPPQVRDQEWTWGEPIVRARGFLSPVLTNFSAEDFISILFVVVILLVCLSMRWFRPTRGMGLPILLLGVLAFVIPHWAYGRFGGVWGLDVRMWVAFAFVASAGLRYTGPRRAGVAIAIAAAFVFGARLYQIAGDWRVYDAQIAEYRAAAAVFRPGERILQAQDAGVPVAGEPGAFRDIYYHFTNYSVLDRSVFLPTLFTDPTKQPVVAAPHLREIDTPVGLPISRGGLRAWGDPAVFDWFDGDIQVGDQRHYGYMWQDRFDYVVLLRGEDAGNPAPELLDPVSEGSYFTIYRVRHGACTGDYPGACERLRVEGRNWEIPRE
ncbi:MAG: hypothetical protein OEZ19_10445 [Paracoccaceae bacterium]|nr:hypothetical protein [Paracoccaceae bacterium]